MATPRRKPAAPAACETVPATTAHPRIGQRQVVLVLQGGGALGAYQAGVYEALHEAGIEPDWVIGTSIGAINAALDRRQPARRQRVERLRAFWHTVAHKGLPALWPGLPGLPTFWTTLQCRQPGPAGLLHTEPPGLARASMSPLDEDDAGYYHTTDLRDTLDALIDPARLDAGAPRLTVGAVNVRTGAMRYFDSRDEDRSTCSMCWPPARCRRHSRRFASATICTGTVASTPTPRSRRCSTTTRDVIHWYSPCNCGAPKAMPAQSMWQVSGRQKDIQLRESGRQPCAPPGADPSPAAHRARTGQGTARRRPQA